MSNVHGNSTRPCSQLHGRCSPPAHLRAGMKNLSDTAWAHGPLLPCWTLYEMQNYLMKTKKKKKKTIVVVVQFLSCVQLFVTPWTAACQASLSFTISQSLLRLMSILFSWWCHSTISSSLPPFSSCPQFCPASESSLKSQFFASAGQNIGAIEKLSFIVSCYKDRSWFWGSLEWLKE